MKYILVTGGVISGIGKGIVSSSLGTILKSCGINVTSIKIDPYINVDAGTFSPYEHGEVYVLDDGGEVDLDLGNYERFLDITLRRDNSITTGKIYEHVIKKERKGDYLGKTVQVVPHITDAIQEWVEKVAGQPVTEDESQPEVCIVELGGTIGDIEGMPFIKAFEDLLFKVKADNFCCVHVSLIATISATGEHKTKTIQKSVRDLKNLGLSPDLLICRSDRPVEDGIKTKVSKLCFVPEEQVVMIHDLSSIYRVPLLMETQGVIEFLKNKLKLEIRMPLPSDFMMKWRALADRIENLRKTVSIALVGKYTKLSDAYASVTKALQHASIKANCKLNLSFIDATHLEPETKITNPVLYHAAWRQLCSSEGVIVPGGFGNRGINGKIEACKMCRERNIPFLGICLGLQTAVIEFARNALKLEDADSTEFNKDTKNPVVIDMPEHNQGDMGGTMRLGKRATKFVTTNSITRQLYGNREIIHERHRHRYEVNPQYVKDLEAGGLSFVGHDEEDIRMEIAELEGHSFYVATQFHPEFLSRPLNPSPVFLGFILASVGKLKLYLAKGCRFSPSQLSDNDSDEGSSIDSNNQDNLKKLIVPTLLTKN